MTLDQVFQSSRNRCLMNPQFISYFYRLLFRTSPEMEGLFDAVNMENQQKMLETALVELADFENFSPEKLEYWLDLSNNHHEIHIKQEHFEAWMRCMLQSVEEHDPEFNDKIKEAWRIKLEQIIGLMTLMY